MSRTTGRLAPILLLAAAGCVTAAAQRQANLRQALDQSRVERAPAEVWPQVLQFLSDRGYELAGDDRRVVGLRARAGIVEALSSGHDTRVRKDGSRVMETGKNDEGLRVRAEGLALPGGGCRVVLTSLKRDDMNPALQQETRDLELELQLLERIDPAAAARVRGVPAPAATASRAADPWEPVRHLVGSWESEGAAGPAGIRWAFDFTTGGQFLEVRGSSILGRAAAGGEPEMGRISRDPVHGRLVWRQFTAGGQVNQYLQQGASGDALVFLSESPESLPPGSRARLTLGSAGPDEILAVFEIAEPGKDFAVVGESRIRRAR
jgi:hypothetical protein